jgi:hypothetical protein
MQHAQRGATFIEMAFLVTVIVFLVVLAVRVTPLYLDHYYLGSFANEMCRDPETPHMTKTEIMQALEKRAYINNIDGLPIAEIYQVSTKKQTIVLEYEHRNAVFGNLDVVASFSMSCNFED